MEKRFKPFAGEKAKLLKAESFEQAKKAGATDIRQVETNYTWSAPPDSRTKTKFLGIEAALRQVASIIELRGFISQDVL